jgi:hypothetical protein
MKRRRRFMLTTPRLTLQDHLSTTAHLKSEHGRGYIHINWYCEKDRPQSTCTGESSGDDKQLLRLATESRQFAKLDGYPVDRISVLL